MKTLSRYLANAIVLGLIVVLLAPAVVAAVRHLALPLTGVVVLVCVFRVVWYRTML